MKVPPAHSQGPNHSSNAGQGQDGLSPGSSGKELALLPTHTGAPSSAKRVGSAVHKPFISRPASLAEVGAGAVGGGHCGRKPQNQI